MVCRTPSNPDKLLCYGSECLVVVPLRGAVVAATAAAAAAAATAVGVIHLLGEVQL